RKIEEFKPDIVHVHNFFPLLSPAVYDAANAAGVPVVQTFHNYRTICANGLFLRNAEPCELCLKKSVAHSLRFGCYRNSIAATAPVFAMIAWHKARGTWNRKPDKIIVPTEFSRRKFIEFGIEPDRITVKPNFSPDHKTTTLSPPPPSEPY